MMTELVKALNKLADIANTNHPDYDEDYLPPSDNCLVTQWRVINEIYKYFEKDFKCPMMSPNGDGGLGVTWRSPDKSLLINFHQDGLNRITWAQDSNYKHADFSFDRIVSLYKWFIGK
jgi:hypothetical protein